MQQINVLVVATPPHMVDAADLGPLRFVDCGSAADGSADDHEWVSEEVIGFCGDYGMADVENQCAKTSPPAQWDCDF